MIPMSTTTPMVASHTIFGSTARRLRFPAGGGALRSRVRRAALPT
jgi:hypothetical protein